MVLLIFIKKILKYHLFLISLILLILFSFNHNNFNTLDQSEYTLKVVSYSKFDQKYLTIKVVDINTNVNYLLKFDKIIEFDFNIDDLIITNSDYLAIKEDDYYYKQGIFGIFFNPIINNYKEGSGIFNNISKYRNNIFNIINNNLHGYESSLLAGLILGADMPYSDSIRNSFKNTNTTHIIAVSGFNINLISQFILSLSDHLSKRKLLILSLISILFFYILVGFDNYPCLRALLMYLINAISIIIGRRISRLNTLGFAIIIILLIFPRSIFNLGLQLSLLSSLSLILLSYLIEKFNLIINSWIIEAFLMTVFCNIGVMPVSLKFNNGISFEGIISNVFISPLIPITTILGIITILISSLNIEILEYPFLLLLSSLLQLMLSVIYYPSLIFN